MLHPGCFVFSAQLFALAVTLGCWAKNLGLNFPKHVMDYPDGCLPQGATCDRNSKMYCCGHCFDNVCTPPTCPDCGFVETGCVPNGRKCGPSTPCCGHCDLSKRLCDGGISSKLLLES